MRSFLWGALCLALMAQAAPALDTAARAALVVDHRTGAVLLAKNADMTLSPASMSKLMTLNMLFEALADGRLKLEDEFRVSAKAAAMGGSKMFLREGARVRVADLIRGIVVQSGNDACVVVAEGLAGSEQAFAEKMTERARQIGLVDSTFTNASGWPEPEHKMSARDLVALSRRLIQTFPEFYPYFAETEFTWEGIRQQNRNPLLYLGIGADGLKTGHTEEAGYGLVASAVKGDRRVVLMIAGLSSTTGREEEAERLVAWAFREFENRVLFKKGTPLAEAAVWLGAAESVPLVPAEDIVATLPVGMRDQVKLSAIYSGPVLAPVAEGQPLGRLVIEAPGLAPVQVPLVAGRAVEEGGYLVRLEATARMLIERVRRWN
ncbi:MAG TPA: D-alanyl-D-alanine carboxypeptidase family protein [Paracoccaceae bacterium]|nr:D-alanyl-D-alanine carboxypeptidase family protein [Paracoccaceae bacterium]